MIRPCIIISPLVIIFQSFQLILADPLDFRTGSGARNASADLASLSIRALIDVEPQYANPLITSVINDSVNKNSAAFPDLINLGLRLLPNSFMQSQDTALLWRSDSIRVEGNSTAAITAEAPHTEADIMSSDCLRDDGNSSSQFSGS